MTVTKRRTSTSESSPASSDQPRTDTDGVEVEDFGLEFEPPSPSTNAATANSPTSPTANVAESASESVGWHLSFNDGRQEGPLHTEVIRHRLAFGSLSSETLIWRSGMPKWEPVNSVPEFRNPSSLQTSVNSASTNSNVGMSPETLELCSNASAVIALVIFVVSLLGGYWGYHWFTGALLFLLAAFIGEALAGVLAAVARIESQIRTLEKGPHSHD